MLILYTKNVDFKLDSELVKGQRSRNARFKSVDLFHVPRDVGTDIHQQIKLFLGWINAAGNHDQIGGLHHRVDQ